jgi:hypothetical protein
MTQYQQVIEALRKLGGKGTNKEICNEIDFNAMGWKAKNPENSVSRCLTTGTDFIKEGEFWLLKSNKGTKQIKEIELSCSDRVSADAIAEHTSKGWAIYGISKVHGFGSVDYEKLLFDMTFDDIIPFNSMSGVSFVAVKKKGLWGLIRFRVNPNYASDKEFYKEAIGTELIDEEAMDLLWHEIKMIEKIEFADINQLKIKYHFDSDATFHSKTIDNVKSKNKGKLREWSDNLKQYTEETFTNLEFGFTPEGTVRMKRNDGTYGYISLSDAISYKYNVHKDKEDTIEQYNNVSEMIKAGWVID